MPPSHLSRHPSPIHSSVHSYSLYAQTGRLVAYLKPHNSLEIGGNQRHTRCSFDNEACRVSEDYDLPRLLLRSRPLLPVRSKLQYYEGFLG